MLYKILYKYVFVYVPCTPKKKCTERGQRPSKNKIGQQEMKHNDKHQTCRGRKQRDPKVYTVSVSITNIATALIVESLHKKTGITRD